MTHDVIINNFHAVKMESSSAKIDQNYVSLTIFLEEIAKRYFYAIEKSIQLNNGTSPPIALDSNHTVSLGSTWNHLEFSIKQLIQLIAGELLPTDGMIRRHSHLKIARYHQHLAEKLDMNLSPLEYMMKEYPDVKEIEDMRKIVGRYGITGKNQVVPISNLSDGLRVSFFSFLKQTCK